MRPALRHGGGVLILEHEALLAGEHEVCRK
jgi:hypothetical protein